MDLVEYLAGLLEGLLFDYTLRTVALGSAILGIVSGALGAFAVLRRQSLLRNQPRRKKGISLNKFLIMVFLYLVLLYFLDYLYLGHSLLFVVFKAK